MSSKIITTVLTVIIIGPFTYLATTDAVSIKQNLQEQTIHIEKLNTEYKELNTELDKIVEVKNNTAIEVEQLETETQNAILERQRLEAELGAD